MTGTRPTGHDDFGPSWPEVVSAVFDGAYHRAGFGEAPQQAVFRILAAGQNLKKTQVWPHLPCLPFSGKPKTAKKTEAFNPPFPDLSILLYLLRLLS